MAGQRSSRVSCLVDLFERVGVLYIGRMMAPTWDQVAPGESPTPKEALELFVGSYAYEYQGAPANFGPAAYRAVHRQRGVLDASRVWSSFCSQVEGGTNSRHNVLYHERSACRCAICSLWARDKRINLVTRARDRLLDDDIALAYAELRMLRGIGPKLASFFLRDVAMRFDLAPKHDRYLLQPVDLWIRRFVHLLAPDQVREDLEVAEWITLHSDRPEQANAGMWYFGAQIAPQRLVYEEAFANPRHASTLVQQHVIRLAQAIRLWNTARSSDE